MLIKLFALMYRILKFYGMQNLFYLSMLSGLFLLSE